jgi:O-antigen/teichoic acid export membrane protein
MKFDVSPTRSLKSAVMWAYVLSWGAQGIAMISTFVLAWRLGPSAFGVVAMAALYVAFIQMFLEMGLGAALVQREDLEPEHCDSVFWLTLLTSLVLMGVSIALAGWWANVNHTADPGKLAKVIIVLSAILPIQGLTVVQESLLKRQMNFKSLAIRTHIATLLGACTSVTLVLVFNWGVWALVAEDVLAATLELALLWRLGTWRPRMRVSIRHLRQILGFSLHVLSSTLGTFAQRRSDSLLIGLFFGPRAVGLYRLADRLVNMVIEIVTRPLIVVLLPHFSRLQNDPNRLRDGAVSNIRSSVLLTVPVMGMLAALATPICAALGPKWAFTAPVIQVLCVIGCVRAVTLFTGPLLQAANRPRSFAYLTWSLAIANVGVFVATGLWLKNADVSRQTLGIAGSRAAVFCLLYVPLNLGAMMRVCRISVWQMLAAITPGAAGCAVVLTVGLMTERAVHSMHLRPLVSLLLAGAVTGSVAAAWALMLDERIRNTAMNLVETVRTRGARRRDVTAVVAPQPDTAAAAA